MKKYKSLSLCLVLLLFVMQGCSAMKANTQTISVICDPPDLILKVNGDTIKCPGKTEVRRNNIALIEAGKEGYAPYTKKVDYHFSKAGVADVLGTALIFFPVIGLLTPGAWDLDQTEFNIILAPVNKQTK